MTRQIIRHQFDDCEQINSPLGRKYKTPNGDLYPSVTTVLSVIGSVHIEEWKKRVGEGVAKEISSKAAKNGTKLHEACELYLLDKQPTFDFTEVLALDMFKLIKPVIDGIHTVHAIESRLWSDKLQVAGSVDLICEFDGVPTIVDWKSSSRFKSKDEISSYFMQAACYSLMFFERTGVAAKKIKIVMATKDDGLLIFDENVSDWLPKFKKVREEFRSIKGF